METRMVALLIAAVLAASPSGPLAAEAPAEEEGRVARELAAVNRSLAELTLLAREHLEARETEILLRRIELQEKRLAPLSEELRRAERERLDRENEIQRMNEYRKETEESRDEARLRDSEAGEAAALEEELKQMNVYLRTLAGEKERIEVRVLDLEDRIADGRDEIALLDEKLGKRLETREKRSR